MTEANSGNHRYFEALGRANGANPITENPCNLLDFALLRLDKDQTWQGSTDNRECVAVILGGKATIAADSQTFTRIGKRANVFGGKPFAVYIPPHTSFQVSAHSSLEVALCYAAEIAGAPAPQPFLITPADVDTGVWGAANFSRNFHGVLVETEQPVQRIIVGETFTPSGNWSTYPPHKHEQEVPGKEVFMEEFYYFRVNPAEGFGLLKHYTDDKAIDNVYTVRDNTILKLDVGYHTYASAPGYMGYYLWFLAGNHRNQNPQVDPTLAWVNKAAPLLNQLKG
jgi:5-deoxy-glucuronate isomerase